MSTEIGSIHYDLNLDDKKFKAGIKRADKSAQTFGNKFKASMEKSTAASKKLGLAVAALGVGMVAVGVKAVKAFQDQERAEAKLSQLIKLNTKNTDENVEALKRQAAALQRVGVVGDEVIMSGQSQLATFALQGESIEKLTPAMLDMVTNLKGVNATQEDMINIGNLVGKVMLGQVGALSRYGVSLTAAQAEQLKHADELERAGLLADILAQNYGGVNEALAQTFEGRMKQAKNNFGDFMEVLGGSITKVIEPMIGAFNDWYDSMGGAEGIIKSLKEKLEEFNDYVPVIVGAIVFALIPAFIALGGAIWGATRPLLPWMAAGALLGLLVDQLAKKMGGWGAMWEKIKEVAQKLWDFLAPIFIPMLTLLWDSIKLLIAAIVEFWEKNKSWLLPVLIFVAKVLGILVLGAILGVIGVIIAIIGVVWIFIKVIGSLIDGFIRGVTYVYRFGAGLRDAVSSAVNWAINKIADLLGAFESIAGKIRGALSGVWGAITGAFSGAFDWVKRKAEEVKGALQKLNPFHRESPSLVDWIQKGTGQMMKDYGSFFDQIGAMATNTRPQLVGAVQQPAESQKQSGNVTIPVTIQAGIFAGTETELENLSEKIIEKADRVLGARGLTITKGKI